MAIAGPDLVGADAKPRITIKPDADANTLTIEDNGIGMSREEVIENLGTIARSGTKAFLERLGRQGRESAALIGQFGVGFYSAFMVADKVDVITRRAGSDKAWRGPPTARAPTRSSPPRWRTLRRAARASSCI